MTYRACIPLLYSCRLQKDLELAQHQLALAQERMAGSEGAQLAAAADATEAQLAEATAAGAAAAARKKELVELAKVSCYRACSMSPAATVYSSAQSAVMPLPGLVRRSGSCLPPDMFIVHRVVYLLACILACDCRRWSGRSGTLRRTAGRAPRRRRTS